MKTKDKIIGAGVGLAALAAAGTYFLYGKRGAKNRETIAGWALQLKGQVLEKLEKLKHIDQKAYHERVGRVKDVGAAQLKVITADLKNGWTAIEKELK